MVASPYLKALPISVQTFSSRVLSSGTMSWRGLWSAKLAAPAQVISAVSMTYLTWLPLGYQNTRNIRQNFSISVYED